MDAHGNQRPVVEAWATNLTHNARGTPLRAPTDALQHVATDRFEFLGMLVDRRRDPPTLTDPYWRAWQFPGSAERAIALADPYLFVPLTLDLLDEPGGLAGDTRGKTRVIEWPHGARAEVRHGTDDIQVSWWWQATDGAADIVATFRPVGDAAPGLEAVAAAPTASPIPLVLPGQYVSALGSTVYHAPAPTYLSSFQPALEMAVRGIETEGPIGETWMLYEFEWYRNMNVTAGMVGGPLANPTGTATDYWWFRMVELPTQRGRDGVLTESYWINMQEHDTATGPAFVMMPQGVVRNPMYVPEPLGIDDLPPMVSFEAVARNHINATDVEVDRIEWVWTVPGFPTSAAYWVQASGCYPNDERPTTVTWSGSDGRIRYGFFEEGYTTINSCSIGVTPPVS